MQSDEVEIQKVQKAVAKGQIGSVHKIFPINAIQPLPRKGLPQQVVAAVREYINMNGLQPGDRLPPERVLIEELGVSRSSVREALGVLSALGLINVRRGDGMYVAAGKDRWQSAAVAVFDATEEHALRNLIETRRGIEHATSRAAAIRASAEDLQQVENFLDDQDFKLKNDPKFDWQPLAFELAIAEAGGNSWLYEVEVMLRDAWVSLSGNLLASVDRRWEWHNEHRAILTSIRGGNVAQAQRLVEAHLSLERFEQDMRSVAGRGID